MMQRLYPIFSVLLFLLSYASYGQNDLDCKVIQCDCTQVEGADEDPGLTDLCLYYEKVLQKKCAEGKKGLKCRADAKGPKAWKMPTPVVKEVVPVTDESKDRKPVTYNSLEQLLDAIRNSGDTRATYALLYSQLLTMQSRYRGLPLAVKITDLSIAVHYPALDFDSALGFLKHASKYDDGIVDISLQNMIKGMSLVDHLGVDQIDTKYRLGVLFNRLKAQGVEVSDFFEAEDTYYNVNLQDFIAECRASLHTDFDKSYMKQLRMVSTSIYLKQLDYLVPPGATNRLKKSIQLIVKDILTWNEKLLDKALVGLETLTKSIENTQLDLLAINTAYLEYHTVFNEDLWSQKRYINSFRNVMDETPIVWNVMRAVLR